MMDGVFVFLANAEAQNHSSVSAHVYPSIASLCWTPKISNSLCNASFIQHASDIPNFDTNDDVDIVNTPNTPACKLKLTMHRQYVETENTFKPIC